MEALRGVQAGECVRHAVDRVESVVRGGDDRLLHGVDGRAPARLGAGITARAAGHPRCAAASATSCRPPARARAMPSPGPGASVIASATQSGRARIGRRWPGQPSQPWCPHHRPGWLPARPAPWMIVCPRSTMAPLPARRRASRCRGSSRPVSQYTRRTPARRSRPTRARSGGHPGARTSMRLRDRRKPRLRATANLTELPILESGTRIHRSDNRRASLRAGFGSRLKKTYSDPGFRGPSTIMGTPCD